MSLIDKINSRLNTTEAWRDVLSAAGVEPKYLTGIPGPCPICQDGVDRFSFDNKFGVGTYMCRQCGAGNGYTLIQKTHGLTFRQAAELIAKQAGINGKMNLQPKNRYASVNYLKHVWDTCEKNGSFGLAKYLVSRGIHKLPRSDVRLANQLRYSGNDYDGSCPAMVCVFRIPDNQPAALHYTFLGPECDRKAKLEKCKTFSKKAAELKGGAIRLMPATGNQIGVCEGVETALAITEMFDIPCWATTGTSLLQAFEPPESIEHLNIYCDNDNNYAGQRAAYVLANRMKTDKRKKRPEHINVFVPTRETGETGNIDWLDVLNRKNVS